MSGAEYPRGWAAWRDVRWAFAVIWLLYLWSPLTAVTGSDSSLPAKVYGVAAIVAFSVVYTCTWVYVFGRMTGGVPPPRIAAIAFTLLVAIALAGVPVLGDKALAFMPYICAVAVFVLPLAAAVAVCAGSLIATVALPKVISGWKTDMGLVAALAITVAIVLLVRFMGLREEAREESERAQEKLASQLAVVAERERVARDVHDILGHTLTVMTLKSELAGRLIDVDPGRAKAEVSEINALAKSALAEVRATVGNARSPDIRSELEAARTALRAAEIEADLPDPDSVTNDPTLAWALREAVTNVVRHSEATTCRVVVDHDSLVVSDNGKGVHGAPFGNGLSGLAARVRDAGGTLEVGGAVEGGTRVKVRLR